jgi:hypothetical protein
MPSFERYLEQTENYFAAIRAAGDLPWFEDPEKRAEIVARMCLPQDIDPLELRRMLFERGRRK